MSGQSEIIEMVTQDDWVISHQGGGGGGRVKDEGHGHGTGGRGLLVQMWGHLALCKIHCKSRKIGKTKLYHIYLCIKESCCTF